MADQRRRQQWQHTGSILVYIAEANRNPDRRRRPYSMRDVLPPDLALEYKAAPGGQFTGRNLRALKGHFDENANAEIKARIAAAAAEE